jgi:DNA-binding PadR family transcriptional regulator
MALTYAILAVLTDRVQSKDDVIKYFENSIGYFWKASHQQIYAEMAQLEQQGWIDVDWHNFKLYRLNAVGKQKLIEWINEPLKALSLQDNLLIEVQVDSFINLSEIKQELVQEQKLHMAKFLTYHIIQEQCFSDQQQITTKVFSYLTVQRGIRYEQEYIDWYNEWISLLTKLCDRTAKQKLSYDLN